MNKTSLLMAAAVLLGASSAYAGDRERAAVGSLLGGVIGAAVGSNVSGQDGAVVGAVLGASAGSYIAIGDDDRRDYADERYYRDDRRQYGDQRYYRDDRRNPRHTSFGPPSHAPAHGWRAQQRDRGWISDDRYYRGDKDERRRRDRREWDD